MARLLTQQPSMESNALGGDSAEEALLRDYPSDLICPITHQLFRDPVLTACGQVYERSAIANHLRFNNTDPVTNIVLPSLALTPVFPMKSRSMEFRERTAKACVERAASFAARDPVALVRRACELVQGLSIKVPGITAELVQYVGSHSSNAYDSLVLRQLAEALKKQRYIDQAANVYYRLLQQAGEDRAQQAELLRCCLSCWAPQEEEEEGGAPGTPGAAAAEPDPSSIAKLAGFIDSQHTFSAGQIIDIMSEAHISQAFLLGLCGHLLSVLQADADWSKYKDVMAKYVQLSSRASREALAALQHRLERVEGLVVVTEQGEEQGQGQGQGEGEGQQGQQRGPLRRLPRRVQLLLQPKSLERMASGVLVVASVLGGQQLPWRVLRTAPLLFLLNRRKAGKRRESE